MPRISAVFLVVGVLLSSAVGPFAAEPVKKVNEPATDAALAGRDFDAQGEYSGYLSGPRRTRRVGWQVVALGEGKFRAVEHAGGLPADGWDRSSRREFDGGWQQSFVAFPDCGEHEALLVGREIWLRDREGTLLGVLRKLHRESPTLGARPPRGAVVLFDGPSQGGRSTDTFQGGRTTPDGLLMVGPTTRRAVGDFFLHLEFRTPFMPAARGQGRGNSGVYIQRRYEVQILDSFGLEGEDNECGGLYKQRAPR